MKDIDTKPAKSSSGPRRPGEAGENTATAAFLERMEQARLKRECVLLLDMRGKVPGLCQLYKHKGRDFYLDDISLKMFQRGLAESNGVFTVGTYESIINGDHTLRMIRQRKEEREADGGGAVSEVLPVATEKTVEIIDFGYFRRRREERLEYVTDVVIEHAGVRYPAKTRNLSASGLQLYLPAAPGFVELDPLQVSFVDMPPSLQGVLERIPYTIMKCEYKDDQVNLSLRRENRDGLDPVGRAIREFIEVSKRKYKLDIEDEISFIHSLLHRRIYAEASAHIPLFVCADDAGQRVAVISSNRSNLSELYFFDQGNGRHDLSALTLPHRVQLLAKMAQGDSATPAILVAYRTADRDQGAGIHSFLNLEMAEQGQFVHMLRFASQQADWRAYRIEVRPIKAPDERKRRIFLEGLMQESTDEADRLANFVEGYQLMLVVTDLSHAVQEAMLARTTAAGPAAANEGHYMVWSGTEMVPITGGSPLRRVPGGPWSRYQEVPLGYYKRRTEERYLLESSVECQWGGKVYSAQSIDISVHGLHVKLDQPLKVQVHDDVLVTFSELQKLVSSVKLKGVPYKARVISNDGLELGLQRILEVKTKDVTDFLSGMFARNQGKIGREFGDARTESSARLHECMFAEHNSSLPFFMSKAENGVVSIDKVAVIDHDARLAKFFQDGNGGYDFSALTETRRMARLANYLQHVRRQPEEARFNKAQKMLVYFYRDQPATVAGSRIVGLTEDELVGVTDKRAFIRQLAMKPDFVIVSLMITPVTTLIDPEIDKIIDPIAHAAKHRAIKLREEVRAIVGLGEMQDVTSVFL